MTRTLLTLLATLLALSALAPALADDGDGFAILVYTRTEGFRHLSIPDAIQAVEELGQDHGFEVEATEDPDVFTAQNLARFDAVMFLLTTGTVVPTEGRAPLEAYIRGGGGWIGVHSAADSEYDWPFYGKLLGGAWFHSHPIQQPGVLDNEAPDHPSTAHLPERWFVPLEEWYSFVANPRGQVRVLLSIDEDTYLQDPNTTYLPWDPNADDPFQPERMLEGESGVMGDHPMVWCRDIDAGRAWYTALGHEAYLYRTSDFRQHLLGGILTAAGQVDADCTPDPVPGERDQNADGAAVDDTGEDDTQVEDTAADADGRGVAALPATGAAAAGVGLTLLLAAAALRHRRPVTP